METPKKAIRETPSFVTRQMDSLHRVVIPSDLRRALDLKGGDVLEFRLRGKEILVRKFDPQGNRLNDLAEAFIPVLTKLLQVPVAICDMQHILADAGAWHSFAKTELSPGLVELIANHEAHPFRTEPCPIVQGENQTASYIAPIVGERCYGAVLVLDNGNKPANEVLPVLDTAAGLLAMQMQEILDPGAEE